MFYYNSDSSFIFNLFANTMVATGACVVLFVAFNVGRLLFNKVFKNR